jgi:GTP-binding protein
MEWRGMPYTLIDTGGISLLKGEKGGDIITQSTVMQADLAIAEADVVFFVVDVQSGVTALDEEVAQRLRQAEKKVFLVCNKADTQDMELHSQDFAALGFERVFSVSAIHDRGIDYLMKSAMAEVPQEPVAKKTSESTEEGMKKRPLRESMHLSKSLLWAGPMWANPLS